MPLAKVTFEDLTHWVARLSLGGLGPSGSGSQCSSCPPRLITPSEAAGFAPTGSRAGPAPAPAPRLRIPHSRQVLDLAVAAGRWRLLVLVLGYTGLRWGEATALRVCDIDLDRRRIDVRRAFSDVGGRVVLGTPKSHQSRTVPIPRFVAREIATAVNGKHLTSSCSPCPAAACMRLSNWRLATFSPARVAPVSATGSGFTTSGTPPPR